MENHFEKMMKPNPKEHYMGEPKEIEVQVLKISEREIIEKVDYPGGGFRYSHQYRENDVWKHIQKYCSKYGTY